MTPHEQALDILNAIETLLGEVPGTKRDHETRIASINFLRQREHQLEALQTADAQDTVPAED